MLTIDMYILRLGVPNALVGYILLNYRNKNYNTFLLSAPSFNFLLQYSIINSMCVYSLQVFEMAPGSSCSDELNQQHVRKSICLPR